LAAAVRAREPTRARAPLGLLGHLGRVEAYVLALDLATDVDALERARVAVVERGEAAARPAQVGIAHGRARRDPRRELAPGRDDVRAPDLRDRPRAGLHAEV